MKKLFLILLLVSICIAASYSPTLLNFNGGQVSPLMEGRTDFPKYASSCRTVENMLLRVHGGASRRPGTYYVAETKTSAVARLIPFEISTDAAYVIEATNGYFRFYVDDGN